MPDDKSKTGAADRTRINVHQAHERAYWCKALHVTQADLRTLVAEHGPMVKDVKAAMIKRIEAAGLN